VSSPLVYAVCTPDLPLPLLLSFFFFNRPTKTHTHAHTHKAYRKEELKKRSFHTFFEGECGFGLEQCEEVFLILALDYLRLEELEHSGCSPQQHLPAANKRVALSTSGC
jgi:hypothetical protein